MKHLRPLLTALLSAALLVTGLASAPARGSTSGPSGDVVLEDHFTSRTLDPTKWLVSTGKSARSDQIWSPSGIQLDSAGLHIISNRVAPTDFVTSGQITSYATMLYGHIDVVARLPHGKGLQPTIWLRSYDQQGQMNGEIDLVEGFGSHPQRFQTTVHHWSHGTEPAPTCMAVGWVPKHTICSTKPPLVQQSYANKYHDYGMDWEPGRITFLLDGVPYFTTTDRIPDTPMALVLNVEVGSFWDGWPTPATPFPTSYDIRSVRMTSIGGQQITAAV